MGDQYHIGNAIRNYCVGMSCIIIKKLMYLVHGVLCRRGLVCRNSSEFREHCGINGPGVVLHDALPILNCKSRQQFMKRDLDSASAAEDMTAFMICEIARTDPLFGGTAESLDMKKCPPDLLIVFDSDR